MDISKTVELKLRLISPHYDDAREAAEWIDQANLMATEGLVTGNDGSYYLVISLPVDRVAELVNELLEEGHFGLWKAKI